MTTFLIISAVLITMSMIVIGRISRLMFEAPTGPNANMYRIGAHGPEHRSFRCANPHYYDCWQPVRSGGKCACCGRSERVEIRY